MTGDCAEILEVNLGAVTRKLWVEKPELRSQVYSEWTKDKYRHHREKQTKQSIQAKERVLNTLMSYRDHSHLSIAGNFRMVTRLKQAMPNHLLAKLVDVVPAEGRNNTSDIVAATLSSFIEYRKQQSRNVVGLLQRGLSGNGLAVAGAHASLKALRYARVDSLVLATEYSPEPGWLCAACQTVEIAAQGPSKCPQCGETEIQEISVKDEMVRLAEQTGCSVHVVDTSDFLLTCGGVGCLLRY